MTAVILAALLMFHHWSGGIIWINPASVTFVRGHATELGYPEGTIVGLCGTNVVLKENVVEVVKALKDAK